MAFKKKSNETGEVKWWAIYSNELWDSLQTALFLNEYNIYLTITQLEALSLSHCIIGSLSRFCIFV